MKQYEPLLLIVLAIALFFGYIDPQYDTVQRLRAEEGEYISALDKAADLDVVRAELLEKRDAFTEDELHELRVLLPQEIDRFRLLNMLDFFARQQGVRLATLSVAGERDQNANSAQASEDSKIYTSFQGSFTFESSYEGFKKFLAALEQSLKVIDVTQVSVSPAEGGSYSFDISFSTYSLK